MGAKPAIRKPTPNPTPQPKADEIPAASNPAHDPITRLSNWDGLSLPDDERWTVERSIPGDTKVQAFDMEIKQGRFHYLKDGTKRLTLVVEYRDFETDANTPARTNDRANGRPPVAPTTSA